MKFRTLQVIIIVGLVAAIVGATVATAQVLLGDAARARIEASIERAEAVFKDAYTRSAELHAAQAEVVANEPRLKAVVATGEVDRPTVLDVAEELQQAVGSQIFILLDGSGRLIADTQAPEAEGVSLVDRPVVQQALEKGRGAAAWADDEGVYQISARRLSFGQEVVGVLLLGHRLEDAFLASIATPTRTATTLNIDGKVVAKASSDDPLSDAHLAEFGALQPAEGLTSLTAPGTWLAHTQKLEAYSGERAILFAAGRSVDAAMAESDALRRTLWFIGLASVLVGFALAYVIASKLARPLEDMSKLAQRYGEGELDARIDLAGPSEALTLGKALHDMAGHLRDAQAELITKERLEGEMEIAERIQTSILPKMPTVPGLEIASHMQTADEVGGDYYDVIAQPEGCWLAIGDVAGHGLKAGLVMMMLQSAISVAAREAGDASPADLLSRVNATLYDNVRERLTQDEHITLTLLRYYPDGRVVHAGAHEDLLIYRAATGEIESIRTEGTWIGIVEDVSDLMPLQEFRLDEGDLLLLYSDGITEARKADGEQFGLESVLDAMREAGPQGANALVDLVQTRVAEFAHEIEDDITLLAVRRTSA